MTDNNWELNELDIELANDGELAVEGSLELPPDLADEAVDGDMVNHLEERRNRPLWRLGRAR